MIERLRRNCAWWAVQIIKYENKKSIAWGKAIKVLEEYFDLGKER